jgi:hypothetical protein
MTPSDRIKQLANVLPTEGTSPAERLVVGTLAYLDEQAAAQPVTKGGVRIVGPCPVIEPAPVVTALTELREMQGNWEAQEADARATRYQLRLLQDERDHQAGNALYWKAEALRVRDERDDLRAELTRLKAENAAVNKKLKDWCDADGIWQSQMEIKLTAAEQTIAQLQSELAWERGWDLLRKAQMQAVVEAAKAFVWSSVGEASSIAYVKLREALSALDQAQQEPPGERAIVVGSKWRHKRSGNVRTVTDTRVRIWLDSGSDWLPDEFRNGNEWVSDPAPPAGETT